MARRQRLLLFALLATLFIAGQQFAASVKPATRSPSKPSQRPPKARPSPEPGAETEEPEQTEQITKRVTKRPLPGTRRGGREKIDHSHFGLRHSHEGVNHAWGTDVEDTHLRCHGMVANESCVSEEDIAFVREHVLFGIITGREDAFRVEVSQCTWLSHLPQENVFVFTDIAPSKPRTPHTWVQLGVPPGIWEKDGDVFSQHIPQGYVRNVRSSGQGYSASWIVAQFRFPMALQYLAGVMQQRNHAADPGKDPSYRDPHPTSATEHPVTVPDPGAAAAKGRSVRDGAIRWVFLLDDDTIVNVGALVRRIKGTDHTKPHYLSRKGWGGAGHLYAAGAMELVRTRMHECVDRWMTRQFKASDAMLLKCAGHLHLGSVKEPTMSHCPASNLRGRMLDPTLVTMHAKKDMYPPVLLAAFRIGLYYHANVCRNQRAHKLLLQYSSCAFGSSCQASGCTAAFDKDRERRWLELSKNNTLRRLPMHLIAPPLGTPSPMADLENVGAHADDGDH